MPTIKKLTRPQAGPPRPKKANQGREKPNRHIYDSTQWRKLRDQIRQKEPLCRMCKKDGVRKAAELIDHIIPINYGGDPFEESNLQPLCRTCHSRKSAAEKQQMSIN